MVQRRDGHTIHLPI